MIGRAFSRSVTRTPGCSSLLATPRRRSNRCACFPRSGPRFGRGWTAEILRTLIAAARDRGAALQLFEDALLAAAPLGMRRPFLVESADLKALLGACYHREHTAIVDALRDRDPDGAGQAMRARLQNVSDNLLGRH